MTRNVYCVSSYKCVISKDLKGCPQKVQLTSTVVAESSEKAKLLFKDHFKISNDIMITCHFICQTDLFQQ